MTPTAISVKVIFISYHRSRLEQSNKAHYCVARFVLTRPFRCATPLIPCFDLFVLIQLRHPLRGATNANLCIRALVFSRSIRLRNFLSNDSNIQLLPVSRISSKIKLTNYFSSGVGVCRHPHSICFYARALPIGMLLLELQRRPN